MRDLEEHPAPVELRADALRNLQAVAWVLAVTARGDGTTCPTWASLTEQTGLSRATVARWLAWLRERGLLVIVEPGRVDEDGNHHAAVYALARRASTSHQVDLDDQSDEDAAGDQVPAANTDPSPIAVAVVPRIVAFVVDETETPPCTPCGSTQDAYAREAGRGLVVLVGGRSSASRPGWSRTRPATTRAERLELVCRLRATVPALRPASDRALRSVLRPWLLDGWTVADVVAALDRRPDDTAWTYEAGVREPLAWLRWRLRPWAGSAAPSVIRAATHAQRLAEQVARRAERDAATSAASPCPEPLRATIRQSIRDAQRARLHAVNNDDQNAPTNTLTNAFPDTARPTHRPHSAFA